MSDPYSILGVTPDASDDEIRQKYLALTRQYPPEQHGKVIALWTIGVLLGPIVGPTLGGYLTDELSWRWAFFINLPIGVLAYVGVVEGMDGEHADHSRPFDWTGFVLLSLALGALQLMLDRGQTLGWFDATEIAAEAWVAALAGYMFLVHTLTHEHPFVDPSLFRDRNLLAAITLMFVTGLSIMSPAVLIPSFLQSLQGYTPTQAGLLQAIRGVSSILAVVVASRLTGRVDARFIVAAGVIASTVGLVLTGGSGGVMRTSPESTWGTGQNPDVPTFPAASTSQYQRALTLGTP